MVLYSLYLLVKDGSLQRPCTYHALLSHPLLSQGKCMLVLSIQLPPLNSNHQLKMKRLEIAKVRVSKDLYKLSYSRGIFIRSSYPVFELNDGICI